VTDLVLEAMVLTAAGGAAGALVAPALLDAVVAASPVVLPAYLSVHIDGLAMAVAIAAILGAGLVAALAPAWFTSGVQPADVLRGSGRGAIGDGREHRWGVLLVGAEVALTLALLVTGSLLLRSFDVAPGSSIGGAPVRIVGVVENVAYDGFVEQGAESGTPQLRTDARWLQGRYDLYVPLVAAPQRIVSIGVATRGNAAALIDPLRRVLGGVAPTSAVHWTSTMADELALETASSRFYSVLVSTYSLGALALTVSSVFAMLSHLVVRRRSEIGLRLALGGEGRDVVRLIARLTAAPIATGVAVGWVLATAGATAAAGLLFGVGRFDVASYALGTGVLVLAAIVAALIPTRRALRTDPMLTMRAE
jgi:hypothetical protein